VQAGLGEAGADGEGLSASRSASGEATHISYSPELAFSPGRRVPLAGRGARAARRLGPSITI